jgi:thioredoxin reductase (NADPH)
MKESDTVLINEKTKKILQRDLAEMKDPVTVLVFTSKDENEIFNEYSRKLLTELSQISEKIIPQFESLGSKLSKKYIATRSPTLIIQPEKYRIRFVGAPAGEEVQALMASLLMVSTGRSILTDASRKRLGDLTENRNVKVFVSPTCPYCPMQSALAVAVAIEKQELIDLEIIEIYENKDIAARYNATSVPQLFINDNLVGQGLQPEEAFVEEIISAASVKIKPVETSEQIEKDVVIIGAGPAGLTAAIYTERSGLNTVVLDKANIGGQVAITPVVENYPGFTKIAGKTLMDMMAQQAIQYTDIHEGEEVLSIEKKDYLFQIKTNKAAYSAKAVLITTGAQSKKLDIPGELEFQGKGISYCAACDGYFFKDGKKVIVVGGGNTAATEALYLKNIGVDVTLVHRRNHLRAEEFLQKSLSEQKIPVLWDTIVREILGDKFVTGVITKNTKDKSSKTVPLDGVFIAIGYVPSNKLASKLGVAVDNEEGYITVDKGYRTNVKGVYAAGDITGGVKQIVTAVGQAAVAAMTIFEDLKHPYWKEQ